MMNADLSPPSWGTEEEIPPLTATQLRLYHQNKKAKTTDDYCFFEDDDQDWLESSSFSSMPSLDDLQNLVVAQQEAATAKTLNETSSGTNDNIDDDRSGLSSLTQILNQMSLAEREKALYDLHGISEHLPDQSAEKVEAWLQAMDRLLAEHAKNHPGLAKAIQMNKKYIRHERIKFLRADEYDPNKAAERMAFYFAMKYDYFCGKSSPQNAKAENETDCSCLPRDLTINDLTDEDLQYWRTGFYQVCREKDRAGRIVCIVLLPLCYRLKIPPESMVRVYLVMNTILTQNEEVCRSGNVHIAYAVGLGEKSVSFIGSDQFTNSVVKAGRYAPLRGIAKHFCYDHDSLHSMFGKYAKPMAVYNAVRFRSHFGTHAEVLYNLMTFGISSESLPISDEGIVDTNFHNGFIDSLLVLQHRRDERMKRHGLHLQVHSTQMSNSYARIKSMSNAIAHEAEDMTRVPVSDTQVPIFALNPTDVVLGRGTDAKNNAGNLRLKLLIEKFFPEYVSPSTSRVQKTNIVNRVLKKMKDGGTRFLVAADENEFTHATTYCWWIQVSDERVRDKISHDLRNMIGAQSKDRKAVRAKEDSDSSSNGPHRFRTSPLQSFMSEDGNGIVCTPGEFDILLGRSNKKSNHGHALLRRALHDFYDEYELANQGKIGSATNSAKTNIVYKVLARTAADNVRFLVRTPDENWESAPPEKVHDKITQDFRNLRFAKKKKRRQPEGGRSES